VTFLASIRDTLIVARFHLRRALRTRSALGLCLVYSLVTTSGAWIFTRVLLELEKQVARMLMVPEVSKPGTMLDTLRERGDLAEMFGDFLDEPGQVAWALDQPFLTVAHFWICLGAMPFLAAAAGAETVSPSIRNRAIRFESLRTGRLELVAGRFVGQAVLIGVALFLAIGGTWIVAMVAMTNQPPLLQLTSLMAITPRIWVWSLPYLGLGLACSQLFANVNFARSMALAGIVFGWILWGVLHSYWMRDLGWITDLIAPLMPHDYALNLWGPGWAWTSSGAILVAIGLAATLAAYPLFRRRNL
jgi:hypothetical protein